MKWFNEERFHGADVSDETVQATLSDYRAHAERMQRWLPVSLHPLTVGDAKLSLHDAYIERLIGRPDARSVTLIVVVGFHQVGYRRLTINYTDADLMTTDFAYLRDMLDAVLPYRRAGTDTLTYLPLTCIAEDELDVIEPTLFEHRFRLHHDVFFQVQFGDAHLTVMERPDRTLSRHLKRAVF